MDSKEQLKLILEAIDDVKAEDITTLDVSKQTSSMDNIVIATGRSEQHVRGIANNLILEAKRLNLDILGHEGIDNGLWALIDLSNTIVHVMTEETREFYKLEKLWSINDSDSED